MKPLWQKLVVFSLLLFCSQGIHALTLTENGKSDYLIAIARDAIPAERTAAQELQEYLEQVTGVEIPIFFEDSNLASAKKIVIGPGSLFKAAFPDLNLATLKKDGIVIKTSGDDLYLAGGRPRGSLYAVYTFLEEVVGVRWWTSSETYVPTKSNLQIPSLDKVYVPQLEYREVHFYDPCSSGVFSARSKMNGHFLPIPENYGGHYKILGWCHTFNEILPPVEYFDSHPEWYSLVGGTRTTDQLCLSNPEMKAEFIQRALEWIERDPTAGIISISQNDNKKPCQCSQCHAIEREEGSPAGPLIRFVNDVAVEIEKQYPDFWVETLAYNHTRKPPEKVKPRDNVIVRLCDIECSFAQTLSDERNAAFCRDIKGWSKISKQLYIWDYIANFTNYMMPHPNMQVMGPNIRIFESCNTIGLFEQGDRGCAAGDFPELRVWVLSHLMWDPALDQDALITEFLTGYYGAAAPYIAEYLKTIHDAVEREDIFLSCYTRGTMDWLKLDDLNKATELFQQAAAKVEGDSTLTRRVRKARLPLDNVWLMYYYNFKTQAQEHGKAFLGPVDPASATEEFINTAYEFNVGDYKEGNSFRQYAEQLRSRYQPQTASLPKTLEVKATGNNYLDLQESRFTIYEPGNWAEFVDDEKASDGSAVRMPGDHLNWAVQCETSDYYSKTWHAYVVVRCETKAKRGNAFTVGIWDNNSDKQLAKLDGRIEDLDGDEYQVYDLGVHKLDKGIMFYALPPGTKAVDYIYIDRIILIPVD